MAEKSVTRWRREPQQTGLMRVTQGERHWSLIRTTGTDERILVETVSADRAEWGRPASRPYKFRVHFPDGRKMKSTAKFDDVKLCKEAADVWYKANKQRFEVSE